MLPALVNLQEEDLARERRQVYERAAWVAAYGPMRQRILDILLACEHVERLLQMAVERLAPHLPVAVGAEIALRSAQGVTLLAALTQAAVAQLRSGGITELTDYDATVDAMRIRIVPHDPTLPNQVTMAKLDHKLDQLRRSAR